MIQHYLPALTTEALYFLKRWVTLRLHISLNGYNYCQCMWIVRQQNDFAINLPKKVFTQKNFVADFIWQKWNDEILFAKTANSFLSHPLGDLCNVCASSIAHWKARGRLPIRHNWFFSLAFTIQMLWVEIRDGPLWMQIFGWKRMSPINQLVSENENDSFMWYRNIGSRSFHFVIKHTCDG